MPILQIEVSDNGKMAAVLDDNNANYINMYDTNGEKIYSVKTTLSGDGYPIDVSISPDAKKRSEEHTLNSSHTDSSRMPSSA